MASKNNKSAIALFSCVHSMRKILLPLLIRENRQREISLINKLSAMVDKAEVLWMKVDGQMVSNKDVTDISCFLLAHEDEVIHTYETYLVMVNMLLVVVTSMYDKTNNPTKKQSLSDIVDVFSELTSCVDPGDSIDVYDRVTEAYNKWVEMLEDTPLLVKRYKSRLYNI